MCSRRVNHVSIITLYRVDAFPDPNALSVLYRLQGILLRFSILLVRAAPRSLLPIEPQQTG